MHEYWLTVATAVDVDPYEMDISAVASSPDVQLLAVGGCSRALEENLRSGNLYCNGQEDTESAGGIPFLVILDANAESVIATLPETLAGTTIADLKFTRDGEKLIYAIQPNQVVVWDVAFQTVETILWDGETSAPRITVSPDGKWIALKTTDQVEIWDTANAAFVAENASVLV